MGLKKKLWIGFLLMIALSLALAAVAIRSFYLLGEITLQEARTSGPQASGSSRLGFAVLNAGYNFRTYQYTFDDDLYNLGMASVAELQRHRDSLKRLVDDLGGDLPRYLPKLAEKWKEIDEAVDRYRAVTEQMHLHSQRIPGLLRDMEAAGAAVSGQVEGYFAGYKELADGEVRELASAEAGKADPGRVERRIGRYITALELTRFTEQTRRLTWHAQAVHNLGERAVIYQNAENNMEELKKIFTNLKNTSALPDWQKKCDEVIAAVVTWENIVDDIMKATNETFRLADQSFNYFSVLRKATADLMDSSMTLIEDSEKQSAARVDASLFWAVAVSLFAVLAGLALAAGITSSIIRPINRIIGDLDADADKMTVTSRQISGASHSLAEGATEQAASLEETSSALEEMASMTRQNADNATCGNEAMQTAGKLVGEGSGMVVRMSQAMNQIADSSEKISHIIKTIEEIAFQTNLLALNAAVEAARAGEAGKGFAVVADEVRGLAQRSAQAVRDTSQLIEGTVARVQNGSEIVSQLTESYQAIENSAGNVARLIQDIATATNEQAQGVDQVNTAIAQMDKVTQRNAASAEQCASASEVLSAEAITLKSVVDDLVGLVTGARRRSPASGHAAAPPPRRPSLVRRRSIPKERS
ncbi:MAG: methyl-accepting chemotaxis protein [Planctomycetes bacterium]|nr:methyl-accepting chemotaxis protein [Planctomycetota bacterium]